MKVGDEVFIGYPAAVQYGEKGAASETKGKKPINELLWGDWARIDEIKGKWFRIRARGQSGWVRKENLQPDRILEVNFVDIGQGDGCHIQTPEDKSIIIDAGEKDNMYRFLRWRFGKFTKKFVFESFVISHPDKDHYQGFDALLDESKVHVGTIYHNSIVEQVLGGSESLGAEEKFNGKNHISGLVRSLNDLKSITDSPARVGGRLYPKMLKKAVDSGRVKNVVGLLTDPDFQKERFLPGYAPADGKSFTLKLLGPVPRVLGSGKLGLPRIGGTGVTKNGHSVVLLLQIGNIRMLLGGDLNEPSQDYLMEHYTGLDPKPNTPAKMELLVEEARKHFQVDFAKACHHGSADVSPTFLQATNPLATIISSGDDNPHSHPRPDTLGIIGRYSTSERPLIFCTELARSSTEHIKHPNQVRAELKSKIEAEHKVLNNPASTAAQKKKANQNLDKHLSIIQRSVANYGMINVRTDGEKAIIAQRLERQRSKSKRWDIYRFETDNRGRLQFKR